VSNLSRRNRFKDASCVASARESCYSRTSCPAYEIRNSEVRGTRLNFSDGTNQHMTTQSERSIGERMSRAAERPSEDLSRSWHVSKSPCCGICLSGPTTGKWCIFVPSSDVDLAWTKVRVAVEEDKLLCVRVSTALRSMGRDGHVICVYARDWADRQDLMRARAVLRSLGFVKELGYKRDMRA
jgi:hypothetical protein